jgi:hypothetical protein
MRFTPRCPSRCLYLNIFAVVFLFILVFVFFSFPHFFLHIERIAWIHTKEIGRHNLQERTLTTVPFPIGVLSPCSFLEFMTNVWSFAPLFLEKASQQEDALERMKLVTSFVVSGLHRVCTLKKPLNPLLGETFQGKFLDGTVILCEQVSHHPPVTLFTLEHPQKKYILSGSLGWSARLKKNSIHAYENTYILFLCCHILTCSRHSHTLPFNRSIYAVILRIPNGECRVKFADGNVLFWNWPHAEVLGVFFGKRVMSYSGLVEIVGKGDMLKCFLEFNPDRRGGRYRNKKSKTPIDCVRGEIRVVEEDDLSPVVAHTVSEDKKEVKKIEKKEKQAARKMARERRKIDKDIKKGVYVDENLLSRLEGSWLRHLDFTDVDPWEAMPTTR